MRTMRFLSVLMVGTMLVGCSQVAGTWVADKSSSSSNPIASVTYAADGTFTANAEYGSNQSRAISGHYEVSGGRLELDMEGKTREYGIEVSGDEMTLTHGDQSSKMIRMK